MNVKVILKIFKNQNTRALTKQNGCSSIHETVFFRLSAVLGIIILVAGSKGVRNSATRGVLRQLRGAALSIKVFHNLKKV